MKVGAVIVALVPFAGCAKKEAPPESQEPTRITLEGVVRGVMVRVDGADVGVTPVQPMVVEPGPHTVELDTGCATLSTTVEVANHEAISVRGQDLEGYETARLVTKATDLQGKLLKVEVMLGERSVGEVEAGNEVEVPACKHRVRLQPVDKPKFGAFMEDISFEPGAVVRRDVVLTPGPDIVRITGGKFRMGPPGPDRYDPEFAPGPGDEVEGWPGIPIFDVDVETFEIDKTEVTAQQYYDCRQAGGCKYDAVRRGQTSAPSERMEHVCVSDDPTRKPKRGREDFPTNCIAAWEAELYCAWVGKRFLANHEWEYAARSGRTDFACPWGGDETIWSCWKSEPEPKEYLKAACSRPEDVSLQGVCDLIGNVGEFAREVTVPPRPYVNEMKIETPFEIRGDHLFGVTFDRWLQRDFKERYDVGFRCARSVRDDKSQPERTQP